jgi:hypothetical protein
VRQYAFAEMRQRKLLRRGMDRAAIYALLGEPYVYFPEGQWSGDWKFEEWRYSLPGGGLGVDFGDDHRVTGFVRWFEDEGHTKPEIW